MSNDRGSPPSWATAGGGENATRARLPSWMVATQATGSSERQDPPNRPDGEEEGPSRPDEESSRASSGDQTVGNPMDAFLPKLRQFLTIVDPDRERASSDADLLGILREYTAPNELFADLDKQLRRKDPSRALPYLSDRYKAQWHQHQGEAASGNEGKETEQHTTGEDDSAPSPQKPRCQYGNKCYRKNPDHIRDFDHTHSPLPAQKDPIDKRKRKRDDETPDDADESDLSFIVKVALSPLGTTQLPQVPDDATDELSPGPTLPAGKQRKGRFTGSYKDDPDYDGGSSGGSSPSGAGGSSPASAKPVWRQGSSFYPYLMASDHDRVPAIRERQQQQHLSDFPPPAEAAEPSQWTREVSSRFGRYGSPGVPSIKLFIGSIPYRVTEADLYPLFAPYGHIIELAIQRSSGGHSKGCAWLREVGALQRYPSESCQSAMVKFCRRDSSQRLVTDARRRAVYLCGMYCPSIRVSNAHESNVKNIDARENDEEPAERSGARRSNNGVTNQSHHSYSSQCSSMDSSAHSSSPTAQQARLLACIRKTAPVIPPACQPGGQLFLVNLPPHETPSSLASLLSRYGNVVHVSLQATGGVDKNSSTATVIMSTAAEATAVAAALDGYTFPDYEDHIVNVRHINPTINQEQSSRLIAASSSSSSPPTDIASNIAMNRIMAGLTKAQETLARHSSVYLGLESFPQSPLPHNCPQCSGHQWLPAITAAAASGQFQSAANLTATAVSAIPVENRPGSPVDLAIEEDPKYKTLIHILCPSLDANKATVIDCFRFKWSTTYPTTTTATTKTTTTTPTTTGTTSITTTTTSTATKTITTTTTTTATTTVVLPDVSLPRSAAVSPTPRTAAIVLVLLIASAVYSAAPQDFL
ncbi:hypothetical protein FOL47_007488 [Perkinsus chesapeaki]|uniref:RRM domain-containing protein n=1 Tax=Perkinsus chesapeaki TaxID=330153 RepID=A0A7J6LL83_PERCH|nr:hypothetical protein FOL47_007488 [Perkinsus chesapeaki]